MVELSISACGEGPAKRGARSTRGVPYTVGLRIEYRRPTCASCKFISSVPSLPPSSKAPQAHPIGVENSISPRCVGHRHRQDTDKTKDSDSDTDTRRRDTHTPTFLLQLQGSLSHCFMLLCSFNVPLPVPVRRGAQCGCLHASTNQGAAQPMEPMDRHCCCLRGIFTHTRGHAH